MFGVMVMVRVNTTQNLNIDPNPQNGIVEGQMPQGRLATRPLGSIFYCRHITGDCSLVRRFCSPKVRKSEIKGSSFRRFCSPKVRKSDDDFYSFLL